MKVQFLQNAYSLSDLEAMTGPELVSLYSLVAENMGRRAVSRFSDRATALKRTWGILQEYDTQPEEAGEEVQEPVVEEAVPVPSPKPKREVKKRGMRFVFPAEDEQKAIKPNSARGRALAVLQREGGATFAQVQEATGWNEKRAYEGIRLIHYYSGYGLRQEERDGEIYIVAHTGLNR